MSTKVRFTTTHNIQNSLVPFLMLDVDAAQKKYWIFVVERKEQPVIVKDYENFFWCESVYQKDIFIQ